MKFSVGIYSYIHITIFKYFSAIFTFDSFVKLSSIMFKLWNLQSTITLSFTLNPISYIFWSIRFNLSSITFLETFLPKAFINDISFFIEEFNNSITMTFILFKLSRINILTRMYLVSPSSFLSFNPSVHVPSSIIKSTLVIPNYCSFLIKNEGNTIFIFFNTEGCRFLSIKICSKFTECYLSKFS